jgi:hypothetical protein
MTDCCTLQFDNVYLVSGPRAGPCGLMLSPATMPANNCACDHCVPCKFVEVTRAIHTLTLLLQPAQTTSHSQPAKCTFVLVLYTRSAAVRTAAEVLMSHSAHEADKAEQQQQRDGR